MTGRSGSSPFATPDPATRRRLEQAAAHALADGALLHTGTFLELVLAARSEAGPVVVAAGVHGEHFPYYGTAPWDQCLLLVGDAGYACCSRVPGETLQVDFDRAAGTATGVVRFGGQMRRVADGRDVAVELDLPIALMRFPVRHLGETYNFLQLDGLLGIRWNPWDVRAERGRLRVDGREIALAAVRGSCEQGVLTNLRAPPFAIACDHVSLTRAGAGGYGVIRLASRALRADSLLGKALDFYLQRSASATVTVCDGQLAEGNPRGARLPRPDEQAALLFEDEVDLGMARVRRQMVKADDADGSALYGLREVYVPGARPARRGSWQPVLAALAALLALALAAAIAVRR